MTIPDRDVVTKDTLYKADIFLNIITRRLHICIKYVSFVYKTSCSLPNVHETRSSHANYSNYDFTLKESEAMAGIH